MRETACHIRNLIFLFFYTLLLCKNCPTNELHISHSIYTCTYGCFVSKSVQKPKPVDIPDKQKHQLNFLLPEAQTSSYRFCYETDMLNYWFLAGNLNAKETEQNITKVSIRKLIPGIKKTCRHYSQKTRAKKQRFSFHPILLLSHHDLVEPIFLAFPGFPFLVRRDKQITYQIQ